MAIFVGLIPQFHYVKKCKYLKIMVWGPTSRASAKSTKLFDRLKPMNSYRVISQLTYEKEKNQFWELFKNGQCPLASPLWGGYEGRGHYDKDFVIVFW